MQTQPMKQVSMSRRLTTALVSTMTIVVVIAAGCFYLFTAAGLEQTFTRKMEQQLSYLDGTLAPLLWNFDHDTVTQVAQTALRDNLIVAVEITDEKGGIVFSAPEQVDDKALLGTRSIRFHNSTVGQLGLRFSRASLDETLNGILLVSLLVWLLAVLSIAILTHLFIRKYFRGPLASFTELANQYRNHPELEPTSSTTFLEFQPIERVVKSLANDVLLKLWELDEHRRLLETEVAKRTKELETSNSALKISEAKLREGKEDLEIANKRLKELDQLKSMFIASMSHELRTPLNSIIGFSGLMLQEVNGKLNDNYKDYSNRVHRAGRHLLALITDVIDISKIEAGRADVSVSPFSLQELMTEAIELLQPEANKKSLAINIHMPAELKMVTDRRRLFQCVINYLSNAIKYSDAGGATITVEQREENVWIEVADTGIGISKTDKSQVFEAFERLDTHLRINAGGTGLGLYLTRKIVIEILNGTVGFDSKEGEGSQFWLEVPIVLEV